MSIRRISVVTGDGTVVLDSNFALAATLPVAVSADDAGVVALSHDDVSDPYAEAYGRLTGTDRYVSRINGAPPSSDGMFIFSGDSCLSWTPANDLEDSDSDPHITLYDLCPACETCDTYALLLRRLEQCKLALNMLKDVNLYGDAATVARMNWLAGERAQLPETCAVGESDTPTLFSSRLLGQYVSMVHMWNYAVSTRNNASEVEVSPDSPSGLVVRTRYAMPDCDSGSTLSLEISVTPEALAIGQAGALSMYVPDVSCEYSPFNGAVTTSSHVSTGASGSVTATFSDMTAAGTAVVMAKFLPFVCLELTDTDGSPISSVRDYIAAGQVDRDVGEASDSDTADPGDTPRSVPATILRTGIVALVVVKNNAAKADYDTSAGYPSVSCAGSNIWKVRIAWAVNGDVKASSSYMFAAAPARLPVSGIMQDDIKLIDV